MCSRNTAPQTISKHILQQEGIRMLCDCSGSELVLISAIIAIEISKCVAEEELEILSALYVTIGDQLALIATQSCST
jgi:hypothetical protein